MEKALNVGSAGSQDVIEFVQAWESLQGALPFVEKQQTKSLSTSMVTVYECRNTTVKQILQHLPYRERNAILLQIEGEFALYEIAEILDMSEEETRRTIWNARQQFYLLYHVLTTDSEGSALVHRITKGRTSLMQVIEPCAIWENQLAFLSAHDLSCLEDTFLKNHLATGSFCAEWLEEYYRIDSLIHGVPVMKHACTLPNEILQKPLPQASRSLRIDRKAGPEFAPELTEEEALLHARLLKALADPTRLRILSLLNRHEGEICVFEIVESFTLEQPTISHHLRILRDAGLVDCRKRGLWAYYYLRREALSRAREVISEFV